jgi:hypothetical protein
MRIARLSSLFAIASFIFAGLDVAHAETFKIEPGVNADAGARAAFTQARAGDKIVFKKGRYDLTGTLSLNASDVEIKGEGGETLLSFAGAPEGSDGLRVSGDAITVADLRIENVKGTGLKASGSNLLIEGVSVARAIGDGVAIMNAQGAIVRKSSAQGARVAGIAVRNSSRVDVIENDVRGNGAGVMVANQPGAPSGAGVRIVKNVIIGNGGDGIGVEIVGGKQVAVLDNQIGDHGTANIFVRAYDGGGGIDPAFSAVPSFVTIEKNTFGRAGFAPSATWRGAVAPGSGLADIVWDGARTYVSGGVPKVEPVLFAIGANRVEKGLPGPRFLSLGLETAGSPASEALPNAQWPLVSKFKPPEAVKLR